MRYIRIYRKSLADYLQSNGFMLWGKIVNERHPDKDTYLFEDTQFIRFVIKYKCIKEAQEKNENSTKLESSNHKRRTTQ